MSMKRLIGRIEESLGTRSGLKKTKGGGAEVALRDIADSFEKKVDYEKAHGGDGGADADTFENWRDTIDFLRELADIASRGGDAAAAFNKGKGVMSRKIKVGNRLKEVGITDWNGFEDAIAEVRGLVGGK